METRNTADVSRNETNNVSHTMVAEWRKSNPVDDLDIRSVSTKALMDEITKGDIRDSRRKNNIVKTVDEMLNRPEYSNLKTEMEKQFSSLPEAEKVFKTRGAMIEVAKNEGASINKHSTGKITKQDVEDYRKANPRHVEWLNSLDRNALEGIVALNRQKAQRRLNNPYMKSVAEKMTQEFPELVKNIKEKYSNLIEPFRTKRTNQAIIAEAHAKGNIIKPSL